MFDTKEAGKLTKNETINFNGGMLHYDGLRYFISQQHQVKNLKPSEFKAFGNSDFIPKRARSSYISAVCRLAVTYNFSIESKIFNTSKENAWFFNKAMQTCLATPNNGLKFLPLGVASTV